MAASKKKPALSPQAAKVLERYRSAGQPKPGDNPGAPAAEGAAIKPGPGAPPPAIRLPTSAQRGK